MNIYPKMTKPLLAMTLMIVVSHSANADRWDWFQKAGGCLALHSLNYSDFRRKVEIELAIDERVRSFNSSDPLKEAYSAGEIVGAQGGLITEFFFKISDAEGDEAAEAYRLKQIAKLGCADIQFSNSTP